MKKVKITVMKRSVYPDLMEKYENPLENPCDMKIGQIFISNNGKKPQGLCANAWEDLERFVVRLAKGEGNFYDGWMKDPYSAMISCNDGFRPVSFLLEAFDEDNKN